MVKHGPCYHCGIEKTPLWRNGPPEKPVLCNACGSRWRIRGTLEDYVPKHALGIMNKPSRRHKATQHKLPLGKIHPNSTINTVHNDQSHSADTKGNPASSDDRCSTGSGDNTSHRTSSGLGSGSGSSSISCSDHSHGEPLSPVYFSNNWNSNIPSRRRSLVQYHNLTFVEKLQKDLYDILQDEETTTLSECPDGNLIYFENGGDREIGLGVLLLKPPAAASPQQESKKIFIGDENNIGDRGILQDLST